MGVKREEQGERVRDDICSELMPTKMRCLVYFCLDSTRLAVRKPLARNEEEK